MTKPVNEKTERVLKELADAHEKTNTTMLNPGKGFLSTLWTISGENSERSEIEAAAQVITGVATTDLRDFSDYARDNGFDTLADSFKKSADLTQEMVDVCPKYSTPDTWYNKPIRMFKDIKAIKRLGSYSQG
jgi:hypothetical protein